MANMLKNSKAVSKVFLVSVIVIVLAVCATTGFVSYQLKPTATPTPTPTPTPAPTATPTTQPTLTPTPPQESISIQSIGYDNARKVLTIYAQSTVDNSPVVNSIIVKDQSGNTIANLGIGTISPTTTGNALAKGTLYTIPSEVYSTGLATGTYMATLVTNAGNSFFSPSFTVTIDPQSYFIR